MYAIVIWLEESTTVPTIIGPYGSDLVFEDANRLRHGCHKVQVCNISEPSFLISLFKERVA